MEELTNAIHLTNAHPITDEVGSNLKPFRFKLTNTCGVGVDYNVNLEVMETESRIASKNIATKVDENAKSILSNNPTAPITYQESDYTAVEAYTIHSGSIEPYGSVEHDIRIWLDESAGNDSQNGTFYSKVVIDARQNQNVMAKLSDYIIEQMEEDASIEEFTHEATSQTPALTDYRYTGSNPNNYVCFGSEEEICPEDNLYRIIGVIPTQSEVGGEYENRVKLIKVNYNNTSSYSSSASVNNWEVSPIRNQLNNTYFDTLNNYKDLIALSVWYLGAPTHQNLQTYTPKQFYNAERSNIKTYSGGNLNITDFIGLMYPSDYGYSMGSSYINSSIYTNQNSYKTYSWLYRSSDWTISSDNFGYSGTQNILTAWRIQLGGFLNDHYVTSSDSCRPTFYLKSNILYKSGSGTEEDPYRIGINE